MKKILPFLVILIIIVAIASCGGAENKVDTNDTIQRMDTAQVKDTAQSNEPAAETPATPRSGAEDAGNNNRNDILANIDKYLVPAISADGGTLTVNNTLDNITFQRAYVEVSELKDDGTPQKTDFYTLTNIEPGTTKSTRITTGNSGAKRVAHIVKAKSSELTNGEMILVGSRYTPK